MNRKKKIIELHKKKWKKTDKRLQNSTKPKYISKAERAKLALEAENQTQTTITNNDS
tara:strand:+ start:320 stop:490 length:171 start_codon:yes stop_codon:yes gene_type:complete